MPSTYRIEGLAGKTQWEGDPTKGDFPASLEGDDREVLIFHDNASNFDPPKPGDEIFGDITKDKRGNWRFKRAKKNAGGGGSFSGGGSSYDKPETIARITRSHSQEMALRALDIAVGKGLFVPKNTDALRAAITAWTDWFDTDVQSASGASESASNGQARAEVPADTAGLTPAQKAHDEALPF